MGKLNSPSPNIEGLIDSCIVRKLKLSFSRDFKKKSN